MPSCPTTAVGHEVFRTRTFYPPAHDPLATTTSQGATCESIATATRTGKLAVSEWASLQSVVADVGHISERVDIWPCLVSIVLAASFPGESHHDQLDAAQQQWHIHAHALQQPDCSPQSHACFAAQLHMLTSQEDSNQRGATPRSPSAPFVLCLYVCGADLKGNRMLSAITVRAICVNVPDVDLPAPGSRRCLAAGYCQLARKCCTLTHAQVGLLCADCAGEHRGGGESNGPSHAVRCFGRRRKPLVVAS